VERLAAASLCTVPASYDELARVYGPSISAVVRRCIPWAKPWDREDVEQYILQQFVANDVIAQFDPAKVADRARDPFRALILAKATLYCRGKAQALATRYGRELSIADAEVGDGSSAWIDQVTDGAVEDDYGLDDDQALERLRAYLATRPPADGQPHLLEMFDDLAARAAAGEPVNSVVVRRKFGGTPKQAAGYLARLRAELREAARVRPAGAADEEPEPPEPELPDFEVDLGVTVLMASEVLRAADILKEASGNQVVGYWSAAEHPLAGFGRTWYLKPAKAELRRYAHLRGEKGGHYEGGHGSPVRRGLIHWLERIGGRPVPPPPRVRPAERRPRAVHFDQLEAALWQMPGSNQAKVDKMLAMARGVFT
jgi:hypothetical protein